MIFHSTQYFGQAGYLWEILADMNIYNMELPSVMNIDNKDHQGMMVDPMFMIVKNLRLFLTAVTPTAVTPTAVIL